MKLPHSLLILSHVILVSLLLAGEHTKGDQPPTVFVLDTSDSDSSATSGSNGESSSISVKNTREEESGKTEIITDDSPQDVKPVANNQSSEKQNSNQRPPQTHTNSAEVDHHHNQSDKAPDQKHQVHQHDSTFKEKHHSPHQHANNSNHQPPEHAASGDPNKHRDSSATRRSLEADSQLGPARDKPTHGPAHSAAHSPTHNPAHGHQPSHHNQQHHDPPPHHNDHPPPHNANHGPGASHDHGHNNKPKSGAPAPHNPPEREQMPKTEERLLISIMSDEDDSYQKPPKQVGTSLNEEVSPHQQQPHHHQKRKPGFTISIQDPSSIKQNGGHSAVILRPTEDGIVIATLGSSVDNNSNKPKPATGGGILGGLLGAVSESINQQTSSIHNEPYREPVNSPVRPVSTTRSPYAGDSYSNSQPITSTLVNGLRPQQPYTDERPQKPTFDEQPISETTRRPTSRPPLQDSSVSSQQDFENTGEQPAGPKYPLNEKNCGIMHETRIVGGEEADPDDFMWMAAIIKSKPRDGEPRPFCGGSLITRRHILTAAHCLEGLAPRDVLVRLGGYDFEDTASSSSADFAIDQFRVPAQYSKKTHVADIAIMRLKTPLQPGDTYKTVCMPQPRRSYVGALGTVTGYGSQSQTFRRAAPKLRQVTVPIWENRKCATVYKKNLTESFLCAGYEEGGKDACQGDSGGPLMTEGPEQKMMIVGVVSHGIGCGAPGYPGVYTRTSTFTDWIEKNTRE